MVKTFAVRVPDRFGIGKGFIMPAFGVTAESAIVALQRDYPEVKNPSVLREYPTLPAFHAAEDSGEVSALLAAS